MQNDGSPSVPVRYQGVWQRTLLQSAAGTDTTTTVFWMQCSRWHGDLRIPSDRPDFSGVASLSDCNAIQLEWMARQQGFAGTTRVETVDGNETCTWHRVVDLQPPSPSLDAAVMSFAPDCLLERGIHADYLEHWSRLCDSTNGTAVLECVDHAGVAPAALRMLMFAGQHVMHVRARAMAWPPETDPACGLRELVDAGHVGLLEFELSFGRRTANGWQITHSSLPWLEQSVVDLQLTADDAREAQLLWNGRLSRWRIHEGCLSCV